MFLFDRKKTDNAHMSRGQPQFKTWSSFWYNLNINKSIKMRHDLEHEGINNNFNNPISIETLNTMLNLDYECNNNKGQYREIYKQIINRKILVFSSGSQVNVTYNMLLYVKQISQHYFFSSRLRKIYKKQPLK